MSTITKKELIDRLAQSTQVKTVAIKAIAQNLLDEIIAELAKGNRLEFRDFGNGIAARFGEVMGRHGPFSLTRRP